VGVTRLTENEAKILGAAHLQADAPLRVVARETGFRENTIRRCLDSLRERKIIAPYAVINIVPLGLTDFGIYFSLAQRKGASREQLLEWIVRHPQVAWVAELSGIYQYVMTFVATHPDEVRRFLEEMTASNGVRIVDKAVATRLEYRAFRARYLSAHKSTIEEIVTFGREGMVRIDELDHAVLVALSDMRYRSDSELARSLKVPASTVQYRIERLRRLGIIKGFMYRLNLERIGFGFFRLLVFERGANPNLHEALVKFCMQHRNITGLVRCLGTWDYELRVELPEVRQLASIVEELTSEFEGAIDKIQAITSLQTRKLVAYPFKTFASVQRSIQSLKELK
jgi:DNA-binding Lrp family transcriptional regulator